MIHKPQLLIFDWDNTLVSAWHKLHYTLSKVMEHYALTPWTLEEVKSRMHNSSREYFPKLFGEKWLEARELFYKIYLDSASGSITPLKGAEETLKVLHKNNIKASILSNKKGDVLRMEVEALQWNNYFDYILGAYDLDEDKPSPKPVYHILEGVQLNKGTQNWFVGDTIVDVQCAINSGCYPIFFGPQIEAAPNPRDHNIDHYHVLSHEELQKLINISIHEGGVEVKEKFLPK